MAVLVAFGHTYWLQSNMTPVVFVIGNGLMRMIVPIFSIIAGYFLYWVTRRGDGMRWLIRVLGLYVFWMVVYVPFWLDQLHGPVSLIKMLLLGYFHLWFMAGILFAGFLILALRRLMHIIAFSLELPVLIGFATLCALIGIAMQYANLAGLAPIGVRQYLNGLFFCFPFVTIGYVLGRRASLMGRDGWPPRGLVLTLLAFGCAALMLEAWLVQARWGDTVMLDIPIGTYIAAPALFLATMEATMPAPPLRLDPISAAVYFMHVLALHLAWNLGVTGLAGLMLFAVGGPALIAMMMGLFPVPGLSRRARSDSRETPHDAESREVAPVRQPAREPRAKADR